MASSSSDRGPAELLEAEVIGFLRRHPDFLCRHPEVLEELEVPHPCGAAVSLIEYQAGVLRDQVRDLRRRMQELLRAARANEELSRRHHRLTLELMGCGALDEVLTRLYHGLREEFQVDLAAVRLVRGARDAADAGLGELLDREVAARELLAPVLAAGRPVCGRLREAQYRVLFGERAVEVGSGALVGLGEVEPIGVLAIASRDPERFRPGMGTVFLRQLGEVVSRALTPYLEPR